MLQKVELYANAKEIARASHSISLAKSFLQSVHLSTEVIMHMHLGNVYGLIIQSEFRRPKFCRIVQILTGTEIS